MADKTIAHVKHPEAYYKEAGKLVGPLVRGIGSCEYETDI